MQINLITGISGSGKSVALRAFEDAGYDCVDNLPVTLLENLITTLEGEKSERVAVAIDARRGQSIAELPQILENLRRNHQVRIVFLNADTNTLIQRFSETRRRHPLSGKTQQTQAATLIEAIDKERNLLEPLRNQAHSIDTSNLPAHALRSWIQDLLKDKPQGLTVIFESFGFKKGLPSEADLVFDVRCLPNPHYDKVLRPMSGKDQPVREFLEKIPEVVSMENDIIQFIEKWLPHYIADGRSYLTVAIGCTGGQHRSVYLVSRIIAHFLPQKDLAALQINFLSRHRELDSIPATVI
ncbi:MULTISPECIES: RNase adapter RapZ [unclassified Polynucleobacter]|uniref:RNase adapter RapZ n=1 Tax=unclassified Polynucleobacter TaxID=2640945 RepID=UPI001BFD6020|nr:MULTISPECIES: RNase adapter RapZ [unclassified Polynucleobacter]MBU3559901.1 RNase adapter RapZ [Polynucleobacter sp. Nonnen-W13]QWE30602.1 RNase adapter RapZ [Polynucleobacter sp. Adler-ghost]